MTWNTLVLRFRAWIAEMKETLETAKSEPATNSPEWYAGLAVSPASFSRQLGDLQVSLLRANTPRANAPQPAGVGAPVAVRSQRTA
jgi:hypothetical protein